MSARSSAHGLQQRVVPVTGMTCDACERRVGRALSAIPGVESVVVSARRGAAVVGGARLPPAAAVDAAIRSAGYQPGTPPWLTSRASTWLTVALSSLAIVAVVLLAGLPCGFTQAVQVYALSTGSPASAGLIMATFAVGTTPGLLAVASAPQIATGRTRGAVLQVVGVVVLAFALLNATAGLRLLGIAGPSAPTEARQVSANVSVADGVQTVHMTQTRDGYLPADTVVHAGIPIVWSIQATSQWDCSAYLRVPDLGVSVDLQDGPNTIRLPALAPGVVPFTCVMGMYAGNLIAIEQPVGG